MLDNPFIKISNSQFNYFMDKIVTILCISGTKQFDTTNKTGATEYAEYFTGRVLNMDENFVTIKHLSKNLNSLFNIDNVIGIIEEEELSQQHPVAEQINQVIRDTKREKQRIPLNTIEDLNNLLK